MIYVDKFIPAMVENHPRWGDKWVGGGHLLGTNLRELHKFAAVIGLRREWFQDTTFPHYDLTRGKRVQAIRAGAVEIATGEFPPDLLVKDFDGNYRRYDRSISRIK